MSEAQAQTVDTYNANTTWTAPANVYTVQVECWGAGGGGGAGTGNPAGGGGGAGGAYVKSTTVNVTPGVTYTVTVGVGGTVGSTTAGGIGGSSWFGATSTILATGGAGGALASSSSSSATGATASTTGSVGATINKGGNGGTGSGGNSAGGGGSSASTAAATANNGGVTTGGTAPTGGAAGGNGGSTTGNGGTGNTGTQPGGGGGGGRAGNGTNRAGGEGGDGRVRITYTVPSCPTATTIAPTTAQTICAGNGATLLTATVNLAGSSGTPTKLYQWYYNTTNSNTIAGATLISGAIAATYTPLSTASEIGTRYYFCVGYAADNGCGQTNTTQSLASVQVKITVNGSLTTTPATICVGGSGTLSAAGSCGSPIGSGGLTITGSWNAATDPVVNRPNASIVNKSACDFENPVSNRGYVATPFTVSVTGNYIFSMTDNADYDGMGYIQTLAAFSPGVCGTWIRGDDDSSSVGSGDEPVLGAGGSGAMSLTAGTTYILVSTTYDASADNNFEWTITGPGILSDPGLVSWYTAVSGGALIGFGSPFNPVGVTNSGLANTNSAGTTTYYASCSGSAVCRTPAAFTIGARPTVTFTSQPLTNMCTGTDAVYTTQAGQSAYVWTFTGILNTDYTIVSGGSSTDNTVTLQWLTTGSKTVTVNYNNASGCNALTATSSTARTVNARPSVSFMAQAGASACSNSSVTYTTQASQTSYAWGFTGILNTDYTIVSGGTSGTNTVTLQWLTAGNKTVTVNYNNASGCNALVAVSSTPTTVTARPVISFTAQPGTAACINGDVTYTTQPGQSTYIWTFPGVLNTNYSITSGGASTDNTVTLKWLTTGSKTVTVNYNNIGGCNALAAVSSTATTVNARPTISFTAQPASGVCANTNVIYTTQSGQLAYAWTFPGILNTDYSIVSGGTSGTNTVTLKWLTAGSKTVTVNYNNTSGCNALAAVSSNTITVTGLPTVAVNASAQSVCATGGTAVLSGNIPLTGTGIWSIVAPSPNTSTGQLSSTTNPSAVFTPTVGGTYTLRWTISNGCSSSFADATINVGVVKTWGGSSWLPSMPTAADAAVITANYDSAVQGGITACSLTVTSGDVMIASGTNVILEGALHVDGGTFTLANNANLIQQTNAVNTGNIVVKRNSAPVFRLDYTLWSSPVLAQQLLAFSPLTATGRFYTFNTASNNYAVESSSNNFETGKGYLIRVRNDWVPYINPTSVTPVSWTGSFIGVPFNQDLVVPVSTAGPTGNTGFNAVGNPYPSAIKTDDFISGNSSAIEGTLWFWRKRNDAANLTSYSTCTTVGCTVNNGHSYADSNYISTGQGFIVKAKTGATAINFTRAMRTANNTNQFFRTESSDRFWLELKNSSDAVYGQNLIVYIPEATLGYNDGLDGLYLNDNPTALTSMADDREVVIQARPVFDAADVLPLVFKTNIADTYTISISQIEGVFNANQQIFIKDNVTNTTHNLKASPYSFVSEEGIFNNRFEVVYESPLATNQPIFTESGVIVYKQNEDLIINSGTTQMDKVQVYDIRGRLLTEKNNVSATEIRLPVHTANQVLIVKITSDTNSIVSKKVVN